MTSSEHIWPGTDAGRLKITCHTWPRCSYHFIFSVRGPKNLSFFHYNIKVKRWHCFRHAFSGSGLVPLHIWIGASLCLIAAPLQVQTEAKSRQKTSVRLFQTSAAVDLRNFQENWLGEGRCLSLSVPSLPVRCSHFESYWLAASKLCSTTFFQCVK